MNKYTEDNLVEQPAIKIFRDQLGFNFVNAYHERCIRKIIKKKLYEPNI